jgi:hypothetical protein
MVGIVQAHGDELAHAAPGHAQAAGRGHHGQGGDVDAAQTLQADGSVKPEARMGQDAVTQTFMTMARLPLEANILTVTVMATKMPFVGRG